MINDDPKRPKRLSTRRAFGMLIVIIVLGVLVLSVRTGLTYYLTSPFNV